MEWWETWNLSFYHQKVDFSPHAFHKLLFLLELGIIDERRMVGMQNTVERRVTFPSNSSHIYLDLTFVIFGHICWNSYHLADGMSISYRKFFLDM